MSNANVNVLDLLPLQYLLRPTRDETLFTLKRYYQGLPDFNQMPIEIIEVAASITLDRIWETPKRKR